MANRSVGEVGVTIGERTYIVRFGNRELAKLEKQWDVAGLSDIYIQGIQTSNVRFIEFARMGLSRHQPTMTEDEVADLLDYRTEDGERPMVVAVTQAFEAVIPKAQTSEAKVTKTAPATMTAPVVTVQ